MVADIFSNLSTPNFFSAATAQTYEGGVSSQSFLFTNLIHVLRKFSSLGKEKTIVRSSPAYLRDNQQHDDIHTP